MHLHMSMTPKITLDYSTWWVGVHQGDIGMCEDDSNDEIVASDGSKEDYTYQVNNLILTCLIRRTRGEMVWTSLLPLPQN